MTRIEIGEKGSHDFYLNLGFLVCGVLARIRYAVLWALPPAFYTMSVWIVSVIAVGSL